MMGGWQIDQLGNTRIVMPRDRDQRRRGANEDRRRHRSAVKLSLAISKKHHKLLNYLAGSRGNAAICDQRYQYIKSQRHCIANREPEWDLRPMLSRGSISLSDIVLGANSLLLFWSRFGRGYRIGRQSDASLALKFCGSTEPEVREGVAASREKRKPNFPKGSIIYKVRADSPIMFA